MDSSNTNTGKKKDDSNEEDKVNEIINKWLILQKIIKEEITLKEMISSQLQIYKNKIEDNYRKYYISKLETREIFENIILIDKNELNKIKKFKEYKDIEKYLGDAYDPIQKLLFLYISC